MWKAMDMLYGNEEEHELDKLEKFNRLPPIKQLNPNTIATLYTILEEHWPILKKELGNNLYTKRNHIYSSFTKKIPLQEMARYKDYIRATNTQENFIAFKTWLAYQWENFKAAPDMGQVDKSLIMWQTHSQKEVERETTFAMLEEANTTEVELEGELEELEDGTQEVRVKKPLYSFVDGNYARVEKVRFRDRRAQNTNNNTRFNRDNNKPTYNNNKSNGYNNNNTRHM